MQLQPYRINIQIRRKAEPAFENLTFKSEDSEDIEELLETIREQINETIEDDMEYQYEQAGQ